MTYTVITDSHNDQSNFMASFKRNGTMGSSVIAS